METKTIKKIYRKQYSPNLYIETSLQNEIDYLCNKCPNLEWSGVLFYNTSGNIETENLEIRCREMYLMDIGGAITTEFSITPEIISFMGKMGLMDCRMGLIH